jgi:hypothetical protein
MSTSTIQATRTLTEQARLMQAECPELFAYLSRRDAALRRALRRAPSPADIELSAVFNYRAHYAQTLRDLSHGVAELARDE